MQSVDYGSVDGPFVGSMSLRVTRNIDHSSHGRFGPYSIATERGSDFDP